MKRIYTIMFTIFVACSSDSPPPPISTGGSMTAGDTGDDTTAGPGEAEGEGEGEGGSTSTGAGPGTATTVSTTESNDDTTTGEPPDTSTSSGGIPDVGGGSTSTGEVCEEWAQYRCRGWAAGLYCREGVGCTEGAGYQFQVNSVDTVDCIDDIYIEVPYVGEVDSAFLFDECRAQCEAQVWDWDEVHPGSTTVDYLFSGVTVCVFEDDGAGGFVPSAQEPADMPAGQNIGHADCAWVDQVPPVEPQVEYVMPATNPDCVAEDCTDWEADVDDVTSSFQPRTNTYTSTVKGTFWASIFEVPRYAELYTCDAGRYHEYINGGVSTWKVKDAVAGELLYELGFRPGDQQVKMAWAGTPGAWTYLDSLDDMAAFYTLHHDKTSFKLEWVRGLVVFKMNLSLI
jgi:hypothetical protein